jgi:hypothetical protein
MDKNSGLRTRDMKLAILFFLQPVDLCDVNAVCHVYSGYQYDGAFIGLLCVFLLCSLSWLPAKDDYRMQRSILSGYKRANSGAVVNPLSYVPCTTDVHVMHF